MRAFQGPVRLRPAGSREKAAGPRSRRLDPTGIGEGLSGSSRDPPDFRTRLRGLAPGPRGKAKRAFAPASRSEAAQREMASPPSDGSQSWDKWGPVATPAPIMIPATPSGGRRRVLALFRRGGDRLIFERRHEGTRRRGGVSPRIACRGPPGDFWPAAEGRSSFSLYLRAFSQKWVRTELSQLKLGLVGPGDMAPIMISATPFCGRRRVSRLFFEAVTALFFERRHEGTRRRGPADAPCIPCRQPTEGFGLRPGGGLLLFLVPSPLP
jgi:hypothetical protein